MKTMTERPQQKAWLRALAETAKEQGISLPPFTGHGMGGARSAKGADGRFITFKRRLVSADQAKIDGVEWTLWLEQDDLPAPVAAFRVPLDPNQENVLETLSLVKGWLLDQWTPDEARLVVGQHPGARLVA